MVPACQRLPCPPPIQTPPYYSDVDLKVKWGHAGAEMKADAAAKYGSASRTIKNEEAFGKPGLAWGVNNSVGFAVKLVPPGCIFADIGPHVSDRLSR